jgi:hypothetical protein
MKATILLFLLSFLLFTNMQCYKGSEPYITPTQPNGLPLETQEGKNTFGCFWNDTLWLPVGKLTIPSMYCTYNPDSNWLTGFFGNTNKNQSISFSFVNINVGYNEFEDVYPNSVRLNNNFEYKCITPSIIKINVTKFIKPRFENNKTITGIFSGKFSATYYKIKQGGKEIDFNDSITISKAVFDLKVY